jgi:hypothetical protein
MNATQVLISYLYHVSSTGNPYGRLGYSLWAEDAYTHIAPLLGIVVEKLQLKPAQMTFLGEHSAIDEKHIKDVREMVTRFAKTNDDMNAIRSVSLTTLKLTGAMLDEIAKEYQLLVTGKSDKYAFLNALK